MEEKKIEIEEQEEELKNRPEESAEEGHSHGEHTHHHHHHHHSKKHKSSRKKRSKAKKFFKKHKKVLIPLLVILLIVVIAAALIAVVEVITDNREVEPAPQSQGVDGVVVLAVPIFDKPQSTVTAGVDAVMDNTDMELPAHTVVESYYSAENRMDISVPVELTVRVVNKPADYAVSEYRIELTNLADPEQVQSFVLQPEEQTLRLSNLYNNTRYDYRITVSFTNEASTCVSGSFFTENTPRIISAEGLYNVRDLGLWQTVDGKTIRQGLLYRGAEMDGAVEEKYTITESARELLLDQLLIRTDMDLRWAVENPEDREALGSRVTHEYYGAPLYTDIFVEENHESVRRIFSELAKEENYPVYMHCTYGIDRAGTVCAVLEALLGVQEEDIRRDYQLSALSRKYLNDISFNSLLVALKQQPGDTLQENAENYLLSIGVTAEEIAELRRILLE